MWDNATGSHVEKPRQAFIDLPCGHRFPTKLQPGGKAWSSYAAFVQGRSCPYCRKLKAKN